MSDGPQPAVPSLRPPDMEVGFNYPWAFNRYGTWIGPRDIKKATPTGRDDKAPAWEAVGDATRGGSLGANLDILKYSLRINKVRVFLLGNAFNYGTRPTPNKEYPDLSDFVAPPKLHPLFGEHFTKMLEVFASRHMQVLPSLIDFGAIYPRRDAGGGYTDIVTTQRQKFLSSITELVDISKKYPDTIFAWEAINEPYWNIMTTGGLAPRPHIFNSFGPDVESSDMASFISDLLKIFEGAGFASTVGHRYVADLDDQVLPTGTMPQFHYYASTPYLPNIPTMYRSDPRSLPNYADTHGAFVGELRYGRDSGNFRRIDSI